MKTLIQIDNFTLKIASAILNELGSLSLELFELIDFKIIEVEEEFCTIQFNKPYLFIIISFAYYGGIQRSIDIAKGKTVNTTFDTVLDKIKAL
jgi:hypothetical protein